MILVMTHGPGTLTGRVPMTVSVFPPGSVTMKDVTGQRPKALHRVYRT